MHTGVRLLPAIPDLRPLVQDVGRGITEFRQNWPNHVITSYKKDVFENKNLVVVCSRVGNLHPGISNTRNWVCSWTKTKYMYVLKVSCLARTRNSESRSISQISKRVVKIFSSNCGPGCLFLESFPEM